MKVIHKGFVYEMAAKLDKVWYHGTITNFDKFDYEYAYISGKSVAQFGPGFYLTTDIELARSYATSEGFIKEVTLKTKQKIKSPKAKIGINFVTSMVDNVKDLSNVLDNWGENPREARKELINSLYQYSPELGECSQMIWRDAYLHQEADFCREMKLHGIDGIVYTQEFKSPILVGFNVDNLIITKTIPASEYDASLVSVST